LDLREVVVERVLAGEEACFKRLMQAHHYLGWLPKIGQSLWYVASFRGEWLALLSFSSAALKCGVRDRWIGWDFRCQYDRLHLLANNSRFLILPGQHHRNLASRILALAERRLVHDWPQRFGHPLWLLETFVDPRHFHGTIYRAANWLELGATRGFRRTRAGYSNEAGAPKQVFVRPLIDRAPARLSAPCLDSRYHHGGPKIMLSADQMRSLTDFFAEVPDPRRAQGRRHPLPAVLAIATAATLCGMKSYKDMAQWARDLSQTARARFKCRYRDRHYAVPSESIIRNVLIRVDPARLDQALRGFNALYGADDDALAMDSKTLCNAIDDAGRQAHIMSVVGHQSATYFTQKKSARCHSPATTR
jgi:hypothetical protein